MYYCTHFIVIDDVHLLGSVQHLPVPVTQPLGLGDLLLEGVAVENVVISLAGGACPNVSCHESGGGGVMFIIVHNCACTLYIHVGDSSTHPLLLQKSR